MKARKLGVMAPVVYLVDLKTRIIYMEHIAGKTMKDILNPAEVDLAGDLIMLASGHFCDIRKPAFPSTRTS